MAFPERWKELLREERAKIPAGLTGKAKMEGHLMAAKRASARYHGHHQRNPSQKNLLKLAAIGGLGVLGFKAYQSKQAADKAKATAAATVTPGGPGGSVMGL